jgi:hypothetical protein
MPKLTLRDLFAIVTIVALALGWWLDHRRLAAESRASRKEAGEYRTRAEVLKSELEQHHDYIVEFIEHGVLMERVQRPP